MSLGSVGGGFEDGDGGSRWEEAGELRAGSAEEGEELLLCAFTPVDMASISRSIGLVIVLARSELGCLRSGGHALSERAGRRRQRCSALRLRRCT